MLKKLGQWIATVNDWIAIHLSLLFATMWLTYAFFFYGFLPIIWPDKMSVFMYWSSTVQLWALPLLGVGTKLLGRDAEKRDQEQFQMIKDELGIIKDDHKILVELLKEQKNVVTRS
jgi:hypothetical protein